MVRGPRGWVWVALACAAAGVGPGRARADVLEFNPDTGLVRVGSGAFGASTVWRGVEVRAGGVDPATGLREFLVAGDFVVTGADTVTASAGTARGLRIVAGNDVRIEPGARIDVSAAGRIGRAGGGGGGANGFGGLGGQGGLGGSFASGGLAGQGGAGGAGGGPFLGGANGSAGSAGAAGQRGNNGGAGGNGLTASPGGAGGAGFGSGGAGGGAGGAGGSGGAGVAGGTASAGGAGGAGGVSGAGGPALADGSPGRDGSPGARGNTGNPGASAPTGAAQGGSAGLGGRNVGAPTAITGGSGGGGGGGGGVGGAGGGAIEIVALGRVELRGSVAADGGNFGVPGATGSSTIGAAGQFGGGGGNPFPGSPGQDIALANDGGRGGNGNFGGLGGDGGRGGNGAPGGGGGTGGGGAGGTIKLDGSVVEAAGGSVSTRGGLGLPPGGAGEDGRFILGRNTVDPFGGSAAGTTLVALADGLGRNLGVRSENPFLAGGGETPNIPGLLGGAEAFGLAPVPASDPFFDGLRDLAPAGALAGLWLLDRGPAGFDFEWDGFHTLALVNLGDETLSLPTLGSGAEDFLAPLRAGGSAVDPRFGGPGDVLLDGLAPGQVYLTLVPVGTAGFRLGAEGLVQVGRIGGVGQAAFLVVPEPSSLALAGVGLGLVLIGPAARRRARRAGVSSGRRSPGTAPGGGNPSWS